MSEQPDIPQAEAAQPVRSIQEVARLTGLSVWTLRYYEKIGLIDPVDRDPSSGHRVYGPGDLARIESLAHLRAAGLSIDAMRTLMHSRGHAPETVDVKIRLLTEHSSEISREIEQLTARRRYIDNRVAYWHAVQAGDDSAVRRLTEEGGALSRDLT
jgi:DNA-binding transcriptional MerR regulator